MIAYKCRFCEAALESPECLSGQSDTCPECGRENDVPDMASLRPGRSEVSGTSPSIARYGLAATNVEIWLWRVGKVLASGLVVIILAFGFGWAWRSMRVSVVTNQIQTIRVVLGIGNNIEALVGYGLGRWFFGGLACVFARLASGKRERTGPKVVAIVVSAILGSLGALGPAIGLPVFTVCVVGLAGGVLSGGMTWAVWAAISTIWTFGAIPVEVEDAPTEQDRDQEDDVARRKGRTHHLQRPWVALGVLACVCVCLAVIVLNAVLRERQPKNGPPSGGPPATAVEKSTPAGGAYKTYTDPNGTFSVDMPAELDMRVTEEEMLLESGKTIRAVTHMADTRQGGCAVTVMDMRDQVRWGTGPTAQRARNVLQGTFSEVGMPVHAVTVAQKAGRTIVKGYGKARDAEPVGGKKIPYDVVIHVHDMGELIFLAMVMGTPDSAKGENARRFLESLHPMKGKIDPPPLPAGESGGKVGKEQTLDLGGGVTMKLVLIPAGKFMMGSPTGEKDRDYDEGPRHEVTISKAFYMGVTEVTQAQWKSVMGTEPWSGRPYGKPGADHAACYISWNDTTSFCKALSKKTGKTVRLPTEAEWEYACRAGSKAIFSFGDDGTKLGEYAWYDKNAYDKGEKYAHPVGRKKANAWGLYDMHGNVFEWCADWFDSYANAKLMDPQGPNIGSQRVCRGGGWGSGPANCRSASRFRSGPVLLADFGGLRVVVPLD